MNNCKVTKTGKYAITNVYAAGSHNGIDITDVNMLGIHSLCDIVAHSAGIVVAVRTDSTGFEDGGSYGNYVKIKHNDRFSTLYAHLTYGSVKVKVGDTVNAGDVVGFMGNTGTSYGGHLHFEVWENGTRIDPTRYLTEDLPSEEPKLQVGKHVKVRFGAYIYGTQNYFTDEFYTLTHTVTEVIGNRVVVYNAKTGNNPVYLSDLSIVDDFSIGDRVKIRKNQDVYGTYLNLEYLDKQTLEISDIYGDRVYIKNAVKGWLECVMHLEDIEHV